MKTMTLPLETVFDMIEHTAASRKACADPIIRIVYRHHPEEYEAYVKERIGAAYETCSEDEADGFPAWAGDFFNMMFTALGLAKAKRIRERFEKDGVFDRPM